MQTGNVVFPGAGGQVPSSPTDRSAFDRAFRRVGESRPMQVEYRPGVPAFLTRASIAAFAPKIGAVVERVAACQGVAMVYSRFIWGGLVPLAIALEHAGFARFEAPPLLRADHRGGGGGGMEALLDGGGHGHGHGHKKNQHGQINNHKQLRERAPTPTYAVISGDRDIRSDDARVLAALRSQANRDGRVLKAILVSDKGSEGLDLKYVREVHVLEPWYHLNKVEQVVGRASRFCSHADLPLSHRNLTVYLHAATRPRAGNDKAWGQGAAETVDLRAYRIAQLKQRRIDRVEALLREIAIDCPLRLGASADGDGAEIKEHTSSQGTKVVLRRRTQQPSKAGSRCEGAPAARGAMDETTYDPERHAFHGATYRRLLGGYFSSKSRVSATFDALWQHVVDGYDMGGEPDRDRASAELGAMIDSRAKVSGPRHGRAGTIVHRGARYLFQPDDEDTTVLTDWERGTPRRFQPIVMDARQMLLSPPPITSVATRDDPDSQDTTPAGAKGHPDATAELDALADDVGTMLTRQRAHPGYYHGAALNAVVDRLSHGRLLALTCACVADESAFQAPLSKRIRALRAKALASLRAAGVVVMTPKGGDTACTFMSPYRPDDPATCIDRKSGRVVDCLTAGDSGGARGAKGAFVNDPPLPPGVIGAIVALPREGRAVFKVLDVALASGVFDKHKPRNDRAPRFADGGRGSGCVCHQSSVLTSERLQQIIEDATPASAPAIPMQGKDKRALCEAYELALRRHNPDAVLRVGWRLALRGRQ
jgi:hypothetical protein